MPVGARGIFGAALLLALAFGAPPAGAEEGAPAAGGWTDPPPRGGTPAPRNEVPARQAEVPAPEPAKVTAAKVTPAKVTLAKDSAAKAVEPKPRQAATRRTGVWILARREPPRIRPVSAASVSRRAERTVIVRHEAVRRPPVAVRRFVPRFAETGFHPRPEAGRAAAARRLPVGRVPASYDRSMSLFDDERGDRIAAARAAGYLVVRGHTSQFPDGRILRTYRPYEGDDQDD